MQAQRKLEFPVAPAEPTVTDDFDWTPRLAGSGRAHAPSPTHLLWDELAARLQDQAAVGTVAAPAIPEAKWPVPVRLATIVALSGVAWGAVYAAALAII